MRLFKAALLFGQLTMVAAHPSFADERGNELAEALRGQVYLIKDFRLSEHTALRPATAQVVQSLADCGIAIDPPSYPPISPPGCFRLQRRFFGSLDPYQDGDYHFWHAQRLNRGQSAVGIELVLSGKSTANHIRIVEIRVGELARPDGFFTFEGFKAEAVIPGRKVVMPDRQLEFALGRIEHAENPRAALVAAQAISLRDTVQRHRDTLRSWAVARASGYAGLDREYRYAFLSWVEELNLPTQDVKAICLAFLAGNSQARADLDRPNLTGEQMLTHVLATLGLAPGGIVDPSSAVFLKEQLRAMSTTDKVRLFFEEYTRAELRHVFLELGGLRELTESVNPDHIGLLVEQLGHSEANHFDALQLLRAVLSRPFEQAALTPLIGLVCKTERPETLSAIWDLMRLRGGVDFFSAYRNEISAALRGCSAETSARAEGLEQLRGVADPWVNDLYLEFVVQDPNNFFGRYVPRQRLTEVQVIRVISALLNNYYVESRSMGIAILDSKQLVPEELFNRVTEAFKARARIETDLVLKQRLYEVIGRRVT